jgi:hypothetical protein
LSCLANERPKLHDSRGPFGGAIVLEEGGRLGALGIRDVGAGLGLAIERSGDDPSNICVEDHGGHPECEGLYGCCGVFANPGKCAELLARLRDLSLVFIADHDR